MQQSGDVPDHDGWHLQWLDNGGSGGGVPGRHPDIHGNSWGAPEGHSESYGVTPENNLFLKPEKCEFEKSEVEYLGVIISQNSTVIYTPPHVLAESAQTDQTPHGLWAVRAFSTQTSSESVRIDSDSA